MSDKVWNKEAIQELLARNDEAVKRALLAVFRRQTAEEQTTERTRESNGVGFTGPDAEILTSFAKQLQTRGFLSPKQLAITRNKIKKYWRQLLDEIETKAGSQQRPAVAATQTHAAYSSF
ncbi:hypothetical protein [Magnetospirillum molischianum]|uniref:Uncharacterized protein n=1 Tax=Magnetospirillum molischianum DSM 120 TaxID=1150626 RepID=H8FXY8_MAGML|nr:hypothetical protein [Magnetospirillum molischianum]CCG43226.1 hypothetical protein PHAMO_80017 [Magnetospirillum molischianum DSM 120]